MDPLSVTASIVAILQLTFKVVEGLKDAKDASKDRIQFKTSIQNVSNLLVALLSRIDESSDAQWHVHARELGQKNGLIYQYRVALELLKEKISDGHGIQIIGKTLLWKYIKDDADRILLRIEQLKSLIQIALEMDHFELSKAIESHVSSLHEDINIIREGMGAIKWDIDRRKHHLVMAWLSSAAFPTQQADLIAHRQVDTGRWFLDSPEFNDWLQGQSKTLFCHGIPGAGKTMLAAIAVDHLHSVETPDVGVAYWYCSYRSQAHQNTPDLLAAILKQLVQDRPSMAQPLSEQYDRHQSQGTKLPLHEVLTALNSVLAQFSKVYIVIDALDECQNQDGTQRQLLEICRNFGKLANLHLMVTSRYIPDIRDHFKDVPQVEVRASNADVKQYVVSKVDQLAKCVRRDRELQELAQSNIVETADGMFLLAHLHLKSLVGLGTKAKVVSALKNLSSGSGALEDAYGEAILRIDSQPHGNRTLAKNALSWISYAQRPFTSGELCHALAVESSEKRLDLDDIPDIDDIVSVCAGLITVDEESQIVRLVHYTTQEYLVSIREKWNRDAQYNIASSCLTYLCFEAFASGSCASDAEFEKRLEQHEFLDYSARYWGHHAATVQERISGLAMVLLHSNDLIACATQAQTVADNVFKFEQYSQKFPKNATGLHLAVSFGLLILSEHLLSSLQGEKVRLADARDSYGQTPLMWAAKKGQLDTVALLLSVDDVNPNARDDQGNTPLIWASRYDHEDTVEQLLLSPNNVDPDAMDNNEWTSLIWAAHNGNKHTLEQLLRHTNNADPYAPDKEGQTLLTWAISSQSRDTVEMLLSSEKFDLSVIDSEGRTLLEHAAERGNNHAVDLLLGLSKVSTLDYCSALSIADHGEHDDTIMLLLNTDKFDPNARDENGWTPLLWAVRYGIAVELLLGTDRVDPNAKIEGGYTPMMLAVLQRDEYCVKMLLSTGKVDLDAKNGEMTPLMLAIHNGYEGIVKLLLRTGKVDLDAKDDKKVTPLIAAIYHGYEGIVKLLLRTGKFNLDAKDDKRIMPLIVAIYNGYEGIVKLLLSADEANFHVEKQSIPELLKLAAERGHKNIVELLESYSCAS